MSCSFTALRACGYEQVNGTSVAGGQAPAPSVPLMRQAPLPQRRMLHTRTYDSDIQTSVSEEYHRHEVLRIRIPASDTFRGLYHPVQSLQGTVAHLVVITIQDLMKMSGYCPAHGTCSCLTPHFGQSHLGIFAVTKHSASHISECLHVLCTRSWTLHLSTHSDVTSTFSTNHGSSLSMMEKASLASRSGMLPIYT